MVLLANKKATATAQANYRALAVYISLKSRLFDRWFRLYKMQREQRNLIKEVYYRQYVHATTILLVSAILLANLMVEQ